MASPLKIAKGLGSAKTGLHHWWLQRLTAIALIPLTIWFVTIIAFINEADYQQSIDLISQPFNGTLLILFIIASFWHSQLGMQVVIEDYVSQKFMRVTLLIIMKYFFIFIGILSIISILKIIL
jgi:succinate dehydrogenase / fumarate reductase membrane anchor subunit